MHQQLANRIQNVVSVALDLVPFAMLIADGSARVIGANRRWTEMTGLNEERSLQSGWLHGLTPDSRLRLQAELHRVLAEGGTSTSDHQIIGGSKPRWSRWWLSRHLVDETPLIAMAAADVDDDYARQASLYHLATHDSLTGLANRSHFMHAIDQALRRNERQSRRVGVVYVDLDGFKKVNDEGGHSLGDRVLFAIGARLRHAVRAADTVARIGGDEFAVLCEGLNAVEQAEIVARRIEHALSESVELDGERWMVPASVGAAVDRGGPDTAENLVDRADRAMYSIKQSRRSGYPPVDEPPGDTVTAAPPATVVVTPAPAAAGAANASATRPPVVAPPTAARPAPPAGAPPVRAIPASPVPASPVPANSVTRSGNAAAPATGTASNAAPGTAGAPGSAGTATTPAVTPAPAVPPAPAAAPPGGASMPQAGSTQAGSTQAGSPAGPGTPTGGAPATGPAERRAPAPEVTASPPSTAPAAGRSEAGASPLGAAPAPSTAPSADPSATSPVAADAGDLSDAERHQLESDVVGLRESLASIRSMLDRLLTPEPPTIDIRDREVPDRQS